MRNVSGSTASENQMIMAIQRVIGAAADGSIGAQTISDIAVKLNADCFPLALTIYNHPCIIARDILPATVSAPLMGYANAISGGFSYNGKPCSILVSNGKVIGGTGCHAHINKTESVLYRMDNGRFGMIRAQYASELPSCLRWAVGGVGLLDNYDPKVEGFTGQYADVLRNTAHTLLGVKNGYCYLCYVSGMTAAQVNNYAKKMGFKYAVMLDGGHVAAINSAETKLNTAQRQYSIIQAI